MLETTAKIPSITNPLGSVWKQPDRSKILLDELSDYALMDSQTFHQLQNYSKAPPAKAYAGKMWRSSKEGKTWFLNWWTDAPDGGFTLNAMEIIIID